MQLTVVTWDIVIAGDARIAAVSVDLRDFQLVALQMPTAWTAATLSFDSRPGLPAGDSRNDAYQAVTDSDGTALTISAAAGKYIVFTTTEKEMVSGLAIAKIHASADQGADREIIGIVQPRG